MKTRITIIILSLLFIAAITIFLYESKLNSQTKNNIVQQSNTAPTGILEGLKDSGAKNFSLQGKVTAIAGNTITINAGIVEGTKQQTITKHVIADKYTTISRQSGSSTVKASLSDIKVGSTITIYTTTYPYDTSDSTPYLILIQK